MRHKSHNKKSSLSQLKIFLTFIALILICAAIVGLRSVFNLLKSQEITVANSAKIDARRPDQIFNYEISDSSGIKRSMKEYQGKRAYIVVNVASK